MSIGDTNSNRVNMNKWNVWIKDWFNSIGDHKYKNVVKKIFLIRKCWW